MEVTGVTLSLAINGIGILFIRDDTSKKWTFQEKGVTIKPATIDKTIEAMGAVLDFIKVLDGGANEVDNLNAIANNFKAEAS